MNNQPFNIIIGGVGGQGLITLLNVIAQAALSKGLAVRTSELHGLSQRGGSVSVHIRFGKKVFSPIVPCGKADLILVLEHQEALAAARFASNKTVFLINQYQTPTLAESVSERQVKNNLAKFNKKVFFLPAAVFTKKELGTNVVAGIFLLSYAALNKQIPLTQEELKQAIKEVMPEKYWQINFKALDLAQKYGKQ